MKDIVERLRMRRNPMLDGEREEAAAEIESLRRESKQSRDAVKLRQLLANANMLLRSASKIATREGKDTNWGGWNSAINAALLDQQPFLYGGEGVYGQMEPRQDPLSQALNEGDGTYKP